MISVFKFYYLCYRGSPPHIVLVDSLPLLDPINMLDNLAISLVNRLLPGLVTRHKDRLAFTHKPRTPGEEITFTAWPKINSDSQIFKYGQSIFCLPHRPNFSDIFDLCLHWVYVVITKRNKRTLKR